MAGKGGTGRPRLNLPRRTIGGMADCRDPDSLNGLSDEQLVVAYRQGQVPALRVLLRRYEQELFPFLVRFVGDRAAAEDMFQEAFLQVHISAHTFDASKRFKPWLFTIAANKARDYLRKVKRQRAAPLSALIDRTQQDGASFIDLLEAETIPPDQAADDAEVARRVRALVQQMPDPLREVLVLAYFHHFAYKEIAAMLSIPLGTVKSRLHAAVGLFARLWKSQDGLARGPSQPG